MRIKKLLASLPLIPLLMGAEGSCKAPESGPVPCEGRPCPGGDPKPERGRVTILYQVSVRKEQVPQDLTMTYTEADGSKTRVRATVETLWLRELLDVKQGAHVSLVAERHGTGGSIICAAYRIKSGKLDLIDQRTIDRPGAADCRVSGIA